jgi:hypothetical protein
MLVSPPGSLKSYMIDQSYKGYPDTLVISDTNVQQIQSLRDDFQHGRYSTLAFTAYEKIYARHASTASNIEAHLMALVEEGFSRMSFEDPRTPMVKARALVVGGMPPAVFARHFREWMESGFNRRFLWVVFSVANPWRIKDAIREWRLIDIETYVPKIPINHEIPYSVTEQESRQLEIWLKDQRGDATPYVLLKKILCVLKWRHRKNPARPMQIIRDLSPCLSKNGGEMILPEPKMNGKVKGVHAGR